MTPQRQPHVAEAHRNPAGRVITSQELMGGAREVFIEHAGEQYRLRITSNNKLILTK